VIDTSLKATDFMNDGDRTAYPVLMITNRYLPAVGGAELQARQLMLGLQRNGHHVEVLTRRIQPDWAATETLDGIPVRRLKPAGLSTRASFFVLLRGFFYLLRYGRRADVLHVHSVGPLALAALLAGRLIRRPVVFRTASYGDLTRRTTALGYMTPTTRFIRRWILPFWLWRWIMRGASGVVALSRETVQEAEQLGLGSRTALIPNGVDTARFHPPASAEEKELLRHELNLPVDTAILIFSGRFSRVKRLDVLINALAEVRRRFHRVILVLAGSGDQQPDSSEAEIRALVDQHGLRDCVRFVGMVEDMPRYLRAADVYVFPSEREGMPNAVLEAMATGLPVIACAIGGLAAVADEQTAWLVPPGDVAAFAEAICEALTHPEMAQARGRAGRERALDTFSLAATVAQYEALYRRVTAARRIQEESK
jgi:glycosyltransferase involved in cell wall biosynthesis